MTFEPIAVVYDGDCAFCTRSLRVLQRLDRRRVMRLYDFHDSKVIASRFPMLAGADFDQAMFAVRSDGAVFRGFFAFKELLKRIPRAWPLLLLCYLPGASRIGPRAYAWVARNRRRLGCGATACELPSDPRG